MRSHGEGKCADAEAGVHKIGAARVVRRYQEADGGHHAHITVLE